MILVLFDTPVNRQRFYPFTNTRSIAAIRYGILTILQKWQMLTNLPVVTLTEAYLQEAIPTSDTYIYIDATVLPTAQFVSQVMQLQPGMALEFKQEVKAFASTTVLSYPILSLGDFNAIPLEAAVCIEHSWDLFKTNDQALRADYELLTKDNISEPLDVTNICFGKHNIFVCPGVTMRACIINAEEGPVYIGKDALVMEGTTIRGPVAIGNYAVVKMGAKLYAGTSIGPYCTAGGEIKNSIMMGYSNKAHDGYLGDSVIGEWCNFGAGTSNSNVKNTAGMVRMWSQSTERFEAVGIKAGLLMGDYSRAAINTTFNTGTVVGTCSNVFGTGFPSKHVPSFTWGTTLYQIDKALHDIDRWMQLKGKTLTEKDSIILRHLQQLQKTPLVL